MKIRKAVLMLILAHGIAGCGSSPGQVPAPAVGSTGAPSGPPPIITSISPARGSTGGTAQITISGTGLSKAATASFGAEARTGFWNPADAAGTRLIFYTLPHAAGAVDVVVTNPDGQSARLSAAYAFVPQTTFDFNGDWSGFPNNGQDNSIRFTIRNNMLFTVSCDDIPQYPGATRTFSPPLPVTDSEFSFVGDGVTFSGRTVAAGEATGTIKLGVCESRAWDAWRD